MMNPTALYIRLVIPLAFWLLLYFDSINSMVSVWSQSKTYEHGFLIVPVCLWLIWQEREKFKANMLAIAWFPAVLLCFPTLLWLIGVTADIGLFEHIAAITSLQLIIWAVIGTPLARRYYFPIIYLFFCVPFGEELVPYLQQVTADISVVAVRLSGIPIYREGLYLTIPNGQFEVAEACSGIRFLISSIALGTLFAYLFFSKLWKQLLFILFSSLFPILANGIRAYGIILVGYHSDMTLAAGADHLIYGWFFFSLVTLITFYVASLFSDKKSEVTTINTTVIAKQSTLNQLSSTVVLVAILGGAYIWASALDRSIEDASPLISSSDIQQNQSRLSWGIQFPKASSQSLHQFNLAEAKVEMYMASYSLRQKHGELISYENELFDKNHWSIASKKNVDLAILQPKLSHKAKLVKGQALRLVNLRGEALNIVYWFCVQDYCSDSKLKLKLHKALLLITGQYEGVEKVTAIASPQLSVSELITSLNAGTLYSLAGAQE